MIGGPAPWRSGSILRLVSDRCLFFSVSAETLAITASGAGIGGMTGAGIALSMLETAVDLGTPQGGCMAVPESGLGVLLPSSDSCGDRRCVTVLDLLLLDP